MGVSCRIVELYSSTKEKQKHWKNRNIGTKPKENTRKKMTTKHQHPPTHVGVVHNNQRLKQYYQQIAIERKHSTMQKKHSKNPKRIRCPGSVWKNKGNQKYPPAPILWNGEVFYYNPPLRGQRVRVNTNGWYTGIISHVAHGRRPRFLIAHDNGTSTERLTKAKYSKTWHFISS